MYIYLDGLQHISLSKSPEWRFLLIQPSYLDECIVLLRPCSGMHPTYQMAVSNHVGQSGVHESLKLLFGICYVEYTGYGINIDLSSK
jgi:hypothetical protein